MILLAHSQYLKKLTKRYNEVKSMWIDQALLKLADKTAYCRDDLLQIFRSEKQGLTNSAFRWTLYNLLQDFIRRLNCQVLKDSHICASWIRLHMDMLLKQVNC